MLAGSTCSCRLSFQKKSTNKNVLFLFRKVHCVAYLTENFVENSLVFCDLFGLCTYTRAHQFSSELQENLWENFLVIDFSLLLYVFFLIGNPGSLKNYMIFSLYERTLTCLVVGRCRGPFINTILKDRQKSWIQSESNPGCYSWCQILVKACLKV